MKTVKAIRWISFDKNIVVREDDDFLDPEQLKILVEIFNLPIKTARNAGREE